MIRKLPLFILLLSLPFVLNAQMQNNNWMCNQYARFDFTSGAPVVSSQYSTLPSTVSALSNRYTGALIFYTDGWNVFDKNGNIMPNGSDLMGPVSNYTIPYPPGSYASNKYYSVAVIPSGIDSNQYYVFTLDAAAGTTGKLHYNIVDITLNGGLGDVVSGQKNIQLADSLCAEMVVAKSDHCTLYLITHNRYTATFKVYEITTAGLNLTPIISTHPQVVLYPVVPGGAYLEAYIKMSHDNTKISMSDLDAYLAMADFNRSNGTITNAYTIDTSSANYTYQWQRTCFSPNDKKLYVENSLQPGQGGGIYQFDLSATSVPISSTQTLVDNTNIYSDLQTGDDNKIYALHFLNDLTHVGCIANPDNPAATCGFAAQALTLQPGQQLTTSFQSLILYPGPDTTAYTHDTSLCSDNVLTLSGRVGADSFLWNDGSVNATHSVGATGTYWVFSAMPCGAIVDTFHVSQANFTVNLGPDTTLCNGSQLLLNGTVPGASYLWQNGSTDSTLTVQSSGIYWVRVSLNGCSATDSIDVNIVTAHVSLGNDTGMCKGDTLVLHPLPASNQYLWQDGSSGSYFNVMQAGSYWVHVIQNGCPAADSISITQTDLQLQLGDDTTLCTGQRIVLRDTSASTHNLWQDGSTGNTYIVTGPGTYTLRASLNGCVKEDSIHIKYVIAPDVSFGDTSLCPGSSLLLNATTDSATYIWQNGSTGATYLVTQQGIYFVTISKNGCVITDSAYVTYPAPGIRLSVTDTLICAGTDITITASSIPGSTYTWQDGTTGQSINVSTGGTYWVSVINICGQYTDTAYINAEICDCKYFVPTAFTPNKDGRNDEAGVDINCNFSNYKFFIYNRWGQEVFHATNISDKWDGTLKGIPQDTGTFFYLLEFTGPKGNTYKGKGDIELIR